MKLVTTLLLLMAASAAVANGQVNARQDTRTLSYAFVSPNTRENLTLAEAQAALNSTGEQQLIRETRDVACRLRQRLDVRRAIGSWTDGAENSTVIRGQVGEPSLRYAASWLGRFANQKAILYFRQQRSGAGRLYVIWLPSRRNDLRAVSSQLETSGISNRTLVWRNHRLIVLVVDLKNELSAKVRRAAKSFAARFSTVQGEGEVVGADDRDKAQQIFSAEVMRYEQVHPAVKNACHK